MGENMMDRVSNAILEAMDLLDKLDATAASIYARAAIEAMREPTAEMIGRRLVLDDVDRDQCRELWQEMIDAALK